MENINEFTVVEYNGNGSYSKGINQVLTRLNKWEYTKTEDDCNHVALINNKFAGAFELMHFSQVLTIQWLSVTEESQKNKWHIGTQILNYSKEQAISAGYEYLRLSVKTANTRALKIYENYGFIEYVREGESIGLQLELQLQRST